MKDKLESKTKKNMQQSQKHLRNRRTIKLTVKRFAYRASRIGSDFQLERSEIQKKYKRAGFSDKFIDSVFDQFYASREDRLIPQWLFENQRRLHFKIPYCPKNELYILKYIDKLKTFANNVFIKSLTY